MESKAFNGYWATQIDVSSHEELNAAWLVSFNHLLQQGNGKRALVEIGRCLDERNPLHPRLSQLQAQELVAHIVPGANLEVIKLKHAPSWWQSKGWTALMERYVSTL